MQPPSLDGLSADSLVDAAPFVEASDAHLAGKLPKPNRATERASGTIHDGVGLGLALEKRSKMNTFSATEKLLVREGKMNSKISS